MVLSPFKPIAKTLDRLKALDERTKQQARHIKRLQRRNARWPGDSICKQSDWPRSRLRYRRSARLGFGWLSCLTSCRSYYYRQLPEMSRRSVNCSRSTRRASSGQPGPL